MNIYGHNRWLTFLLSFSAGLILSISSFHASSEDIDIFSTDLDQSVNKPNVLIILDNSANWSRQSQQWPDGDTQGESEARAIEDVVTNLEENSVNVGLMMYRTQGNAANTDNGYIRYHIRPMNAANKADFATHTQTIENNINDPVEKRSQSNPQGHLMWDAYNYLAGLDSVSAGAGTPATRADSAGYDSLYDNFRAPLASTDTCTRTIIIYIGNNRNGSLREDSAENVSALQGLGGDITQIPFAEYEVTTSVATSPIGYSNTCYTSTANCTTAEGATCVLDDGFDSCQCIDNATYPAMACSSLEKFTVIGRSSGSRTLESTTTISGPTTQGTGEATQCPNNKNSDPNPYSCPSDQTVTSPGPGMNEETDTITSWSNCAYTKQENACGNGNNKHLWTPMGDKTVTEKVYSITPTDTDLGFNPLCSLDAASCDLSSFNGCPDSGASFDGTYDSCFCQAPSTATGCSASTNRYQVEGTYTSSEANATGNFVSPPAGDIMADEWARFLRSKGVPLPGGLGNALVTTYTIDVFNAQQSADFSGLLFNMARVGGGKYYQAKNETAIKAALQEIFTEIQAVNSAFSSASLPVNATNRAQNENQVFIGLFRPDRQKKPLWFGNLKRYQLIDTNGDIELGDKNGDPAINELTGFVTDCAVSYWTTDSGNYWEPVISADPKPISNCTSATTNEYSDLPDGPFVEKGAVAEVLRKGNNPASSADSDGNYTNANRVVKTLTGGSLANFTVANSGGFFDSGISKHINIVKFIRGEDRLDEDLDSPGAAIPDLTLSEPRSTIHGDVVHSRPQPVNYGSSTVIVYYGANDGTYRAVDASNGKELWSFIAPEHFSQLERLFDNSPNIKFSGDAAPSIPKGYFFDGSTGVFQTFDNNDDADEVIIFPSMRRGGRKVYAFDVTTAASPAYLWDMGCENPAPDTASCDTDNNGTDGDFTEMGQSWSQPAAAFIKGHSTTEPVVIFGGGYDTCDDADSGSPTCAGAVGSGVYVVEGRTGDLLKHFDFNANSVAADVTLIDVDQDAMIDYAYAVDTGGNFYRMDFKDAGGPLAPASWTWTKIAFTDGDSDGDVRKFLFAPAIIQATPTIAYLAVGSGDREHPLYSDYPVTNPVVNRFYVFKDNFTVTPGTPLDLDDTTVMNDFTTDPTCADPGVQPGDAIQGWFFDLTDHGPGEQVVTSAVIAAGQVIFSTNRATTVSPTACTNSLGEARGYSVNLFSGSGTIAVDGICGGDRSSEFVGGGLPPSPVISTVPVDGVVRTVIIGGPQQDGSASSPIEAQLVVPPIQSNRRPVYWFKTGDTD